MSGLNNFTGMMPELGGLMLPFMITDRDQAYEVYDGPIGQEAAAEFENFDLKVLGFPENGFREITNNRGPIVEPKDLEGLRMRTNNSEALNDMFALLKANPQQIPVADSCKKTSKMSSKHAKRHENIQNALTISKVSSKNVMKIATTS